jgi:iron complex outermembrane receptor protein
MLHGPNVLGGVVEMKVGRGSVADARRALAVTIGGDSQGGYAATAIGERPFETSGGRGTFRVGAGFRDSPGVPLPGGVSEPIATGDGLRLNTDMRNLNGFFSARYTSDRGPWASLSTAAFDAERGIAGELGTDEPRLWRYPDVTRTVVAASGGSGFHDTPWGRGDLEMSVGVDAGTTQINSYTTRSYDEIDGTEEGIDRTVTLRLLGDHTMGSRGDFRTSLTLADIRHESVEDGVRTKYGQRLFSLAGETVWRVLDAPTGPLEGVRLSVGGAWDRGTTPETGGRESLGTIDDWGGRIGLSGLFGGGGTLVHASISRRGRFPSLRETYSEALNRFVPNPDLAPEHLVAFEVGVTARVGQGEIQVVGFRHDLDGAIRRITLEGGKRMRINSDELQSTGVELFASQEWGRVAIGGDLTLQSVDLIGGGSSVSMRPENTPERVGSAYLRFPFLAGIDATASAEYTGPQFCQAPGSGVDVELEGGSWFNASLSRLFVAPGGRARGRRIEARVSAANLGDTALYDQCGLPRPGRSLQFQLRVF